jgi:hypothetical protein
LAALVLIGEQNISLKPLKQTCIRAAGAINTGTLPVLLLRAFELLQPTRGPYP